MRISIILALVSAAALVACKPPAVTVTDPTTGKKSEISIDSSGATNTININGPDGKGSLSYSQGGDAPKNLPSYVPPYPGATYTASFATDGAMAGAGGAGGAPAKAGMVNFTTSDSAQQVLSFYKDAFISGGLKETVGGNFDGQQLLSYSKESSPTEGAQVMAKQSPQGKTEVSVMYTAK